MESLPSTSPTLLVRVARSDDPLAWLEFARIYGPIVQRVACRKGLQHADAEDISQDVLKAVMAAIGQFRHEPGTGALRRWLFTITRNRLMDFFRSAKQRDRGAGGTDAGDRLHELPATIDEQEWDQEYERQVLHYAAERVRSEFQANTWRAFWRTAYDGVPGPAVAAELGMSLGSVHVARSRVLARIRKVVEEITGDGEVRLP